MSVVAKRYVIYDLASQKYIRTDTSTDDVAFNALAVGGASGPVISASSGNISVGNVRLVNVSDPVDNTDVANKSYVDAVASGLLPKQPCLVATTASDWASVTVTSGSGTEASPLLLASMPSGTTYPRFDGVQLALNDRVLIKNFVTGNRIYNGLYYLSEAVSDTSAKFIRTADADNSPVVGEVKGGTFTFVTSGDDYADTGWVLSMPNGNVDLLTDPIEFAQFSAAGVILPGAGLSQSGVTFNIGEGNGIQVNNDSIEVKLDGSTLSVGSSGLSVNLETLAGSGIVVSGSALDVGQGDGITVSSNSIALADTVAGDGLAYSSGVISVGQGDGLSVTSNSVALADTVAGDGLAYSSGVISVGSGDGITVSSNSISLSDTVAGDGLTYSSGVINVGEGDGITVSSNSITVKLDSSQAVLSKSSDGLKIDLANSTLTTTASGLAIDAGLAGDGLGWSVDALVVNTGSGLTTSGDSVVVTDGALFCDATPKLAADLDVNNFAIKAATGGNINFTPGAGTIAIAGETSGTINLKAPATADSTTYVLPNAGSNGQYLMTDTSGVLSWNTVDLTSVTLQGAYENSTDPATITTSSAEGSVIIAGTESLQITATNGIDMTNKVISTTTSNGKIVIAPNGTGAFQLSSTGDSRGAWAVDLQMSRAANTNVASGEGSAIGGGFANTATGDYSAVGGGNTNIAQGDYSTVGGGGTNTANGAAATIGGGSSNLATGGFTTVNGGYHNTSTSTASTVLGGEYNTASNHYAISGGRGANTSAACDLVVGNNADATSSSAANVHFRVAGDTSNVAIGRRTNQDPVSGATNTLELHTTASGAQSFYVGLKAPTLAGSSTYTLPATYGTDAQVMKTDASGNLYWGDGIIYTENLQNKEGSSVPTGSTVYVSAEGQFKLVNANDSFIGEGTIFGFTGATLANDATGSVYTMPDARFVGTVDGNGQLDGGFIVAPFDLPDNCISTTSGNITFDVTVYAGSGVVAGDIVTLAGIVGPIAGIPQANFNTYLTVNTVTPSGAYDIWRLEGNTTAADATLSNQGGTAGTYTRNSLTVNEAVYLSLVDGQVTQNISNFVTGNHVVRLGYARGNLEFHMTPEYIIQL